MRAFEAFIPVPKETGVIMVIEKQFGPQGAQDWAKITGGLANIVKCTFGTGALYKEDVLKGKVAAFKTAGINPMVGGTLTEVAVMSQQKLDLGKLEAYLQYAKELGFTYVEFSDGSIYIPDDKRRDIIQRCSRVGINVISEVGKKDPKKDALITLEQRIALMKADLESGAEMVIIEAREAGKGLGVISKTGEVDFTMLDQIMNTVGLDKTMVEAPDKGQQQALYMKYGPKVNVGNIQPQDVLSTAALRSGLRGDTIKSLRLDDWKAYHQSVNAPDIY
ncbi:MAG: phosphosulfolactate synthase [Sedimentisphaerales bacterium]|nr:phosphosulfolactate synthase [Sedimentisphaerales bacterium]